VLALALFPTGFFLIAPYTEGLFLALSLGALLAARQERWWLAGICGFGAALARPQGVLLVLPLGYEYLRQKRVGPWVLGNGGSPPDERAVAALAPLLGLAAVTIYWRKALGEGGGVVDVQWLWGYRVVTPFEALAASIGFVLGGGNPAMLSPAWVEALNLACIVGFAILGVLAFHRLPLAYSLYLWPALGLLFFREMSFSPLMSVSRYVLVLFPGFIVLAMLLAPRPRLGLALLTVSGLLQMVLFWLWVQWTFIA
jgi:hypothetical protein